MAAVVVGHRDLTPLELLQGMHAYPYALVVLEGLLRGDEVSLVPGGSTVRHGPPPELAPSEAAWLRARGRGTEL